MTRLAPAALALATGCTVVVVGPPLSHRPAPGDAVEARATQGIYLSTGGAPRPYRTLGFAQVLGYGVLAAGVVEVGDATLGRAVHDGLLRAARELGGDGVINIEFHDENPPTDYDRATQAVNTINALARRQQPEEKRRTVVVTGEIVRFLPESP
jgi:hypothetical protein